MRPQVVNIVMTMCISLYFSSITLAFDSRVVLSIVSLLVVFTFRVECIHIRKKYREQCIRGFKHRWNTRGVQGNTQQIQSILKNTKPYKKYKVLGLWGEPVPMQTWKGRSRSNAIFFNWGPWSGLHEAYASEVIAIVMGKVHSSAKCSWT